MPQTKNNTITILTITAKFFILIPPLI